jgi:predicted Zn-dependent peptidase
MYKDSPDWECLFNLLGAMYHNHPVRIDIAGTKESIAQISEDMLFSCYDTFYNLSNMALAVAGNVTLEEVIEIADHMLAESEPVTVERAFEEEPETIVTNYVEEHLPVATPVFCFGYKENIEGEENTLEEELAMSLIMDVAAGQMSTFYKELLDEGLVNNTFTTEFFNGHNYAVSMFSGESADPRAVARRINERFAELKKTLITEEDFEIVRKKQYGKTVRAFSDIDTLSNGLVISHFENEDLFAEFKVIKEMKLSFVNDMLQRSFDENKAVLSVVCQQK